jgi:predicted kinase
MVSSGKSPSVLLMCGLPASGKTTAAERICAYSGGVLIRSCDVYRSLGISLPDWVRRTEGFTRHVPEYLRERDRAYVEMARRLEQALAAGSDLVIVDAVHGEWAKRRIVYQLCQAYRRTPILIWSQCDDPEAIRSRFQRRRGSEAEPQNEASDISVFHHIAALWEDPIADPQPVPMVIYDTWRDQLLPMRGSMGPVVELLRSALTIAPSA